MDLSLSPPSGLDSPNGSSSLSPERQGSGDLPPLPTAVDFQPLRYLDGVPSSFQFFLPLGSGGALHLPASSFLPPPKDKCLSPELPLAKQLVCRWAKVSGDWEKWWGLGQYPTWAQHPAWLHSVTSSLSSSKTWLTMSMTIMSSRNRMLDTAVTGRAVPAMAVASMPGEGAG